MDFILAEVKMGEKVDLTAFQFSPFRLVSWLRHSWNQEQQFFSLSAGFITDKAKEQQQQHVTLYSDSKATPNKINSATLFYARFNSNLWNSF